MYDNMLLFAGGDYLGRILAAGGGVSATLNGIELDATFKGGRPESYSGRLESFGIKITEKGVAIRGSLHSFLHGSNHGRMTLDQASLAIAQLEEKLGIPSSALKVVKLEYGLNLDWHQPIARFLSCLCFHRRAELDRMRHGTYAYGLKHFLSKYNLKLYDKAYQILKKSKGTIRVSHHILRIEIQYKYVSRFPTGQLTLADLTKLETLSVFQADLQKSLASLLLEEEQLDLSKYTVSQTKLLLAGRNPAFWDNCKARTKEGWKKSWRDYNNLLAGKEDGLAQMLKQRVQEEYENIIQEGILNPIVADRGSFFPPPRLNHFPLIEEEDNERLRHWPSTPFPTYP